MKNKTDTQKIIELLMPAFGEVLKEDGSYLNDIRVSIEHVRREPLVKFSSYIDCERIDADSLELLRDKIKAFDKNGSKARILLKRKQQIESDLALVEKDISELSAAVSLDGSGGVEQPAAPAYAAGEFHKPDGGRVDCGLSGENKDCTVRATAIVKQISYTP